MAFPAGRIEEEAEEEESSSDSETEQQEGAGVRRTLETRVPKAVSKAVVLEVGCGPNVRTMRYAVRKR